MRTADYWQRGMTTDEYLARMTRKRELFERRIPATQITEAERAAFGEEPLRFLIFTEDFCGDSAQFIPPIMKLARELDNVEVRLLLRDEYREVAGQYTRRDGYAAIPAIVVLDADGNELGHLVERPARVYTELANETRRFAKENPRLDGINRTYDKMPPETKAAVLANSERFRDTQQALWTRWLFEDLAEIVTDGTRRRSSELVTTTLG